MSESSNEKGEEAEVSFWLKSSCAELIDYLSVKLNIPPGRLIGRMLRRLKEKIRTESPESERHQQVKEE